MLVSSLSQSARVKSIAVHVTMEYEIPVPLKLNNVVFCDGITYCFRGTVPF